MTFSFLQEAPALCSTALLVLPTADQVSQTSISMETAMPATNLLEEFVWVSHTTTAFATGPNCTNAASSTYTCIRQQPLKRCTHG